MKLQFKISYFTKWGQELLVVGNIPELGNGNIAKAANLHFNGGESWSLLINADLPKNFQLEYKYILKDANTGITTPEWGEYRKKEVHDKFAVTDFIDAWRSAASVENTFLSAPFTQVLLQKEHTPIARIKCTNPTHHFSVYAPTLKKGEVLCIIGNCKELGNWTVEKPVLMDNADYPKWQVELNLRNVNQEIHYKYGIYNIEEKQFIHFEAGQDRIVPGGSNNNCVDISDNFINKTDQSWKGAGMSIPVFSLRSKRSYGCGDFTDLKLMADWANKVNLKLIQVLPLNDTVGTHTQEDVLPYAAISAFALNPLFMDLDQIPLDKKHPLYKKFSETREALNNQDLMDYLTVINFKLEYLEAAFLQEKTKFLKQKDFLAFKKENDHWLLPYSLYCCLRDKKGTSDYRQWDEFANYSEEFISEYIDVKHPWFDKIATQWYIQYHLDKQLKEAVAHAHNLGVVVKGDIPIGVNRNSVDTWVSPELFHMDMQAGAPPDMFAIKGQNWELPTYNWENIAATEFDWWCKRFEQMAHYFDTFRVDHILGFFRIWQIPMDHEEGIMGYLNPSVPLYKDEFENKGLHFNKERYTIPYITDEILWNNFGEEQDYVKENFLYIEYGFAYRIKTEFAKQKVIKALFEEGKISERVKFGMFDLISNILLIEKEGSNGNEFYPRYGMHSLPTYAALSDKEKEVFNELYIDYFYRRQDARWYQSGMDKLPALKAASNMLICGEDLGMMTPCVTSVMNELAILSLEVQRAPKTDTKEFFHPNDAPYLSVVTPSTHDMSTIRGWWEEEYELSQRFYNQELGHWGEAPYFCEWWICRDILLQHLYSPAMWSIFQWQDLLSISPELRRVDPNDERINVPSNSFSSWRYRMHINLEDLLEKTEYNDTLRNYIVNSGR